MPAVLQLATRSHGAFVVDLLALSPPAAEGEDGDDSSPKDSSPAADGSVTDPAIAIRDAMRSALLTPFTNSDEVTASSPPYPRLTPPPPATSRHRPPPPA